MQLSFCWCVIPLSSVVGSTRGINRRPWCKQIMMAVGVCRGELFLNLYKEREMYRRK